MKMDSFNAVIAFRLWIVIVRRAIMEMAERFKLIAEREPFAPYRESAYVNAHSMQERFKTLAE